MSTRPTVWQAAALLYLALPMFLFLLFFSRYVLAVPAVCFMAWATWQLLRNGVEQSVSRAVAGPLLLLALVLVASSGLMPPLWQLTDYPKHYAILHLLVDNHWPVVVDLGNGHEVLRYYLGWYLVPAGLCKLLGSGAITGTVLAWTALGLWLVFLLLAEALKPKNRWQALAAAALFMFFSGADQLGQTLTGHILPYPDHFEWWATFYQYPSMMTGLVWAPQHGLAAWLSVGLLINATAQPRLIAHAGLLFFAVFFWSPFCALGIVPFVLVAAGSVGFRHLLSRSNFLSVPAIAPALLGYSFSDTGQIFRAWIWEFPNWTFQNLVAFWVLEFAIFAAVVFAIGTRRTTMFRVAVIVLLLVPFYSVGAFNDFSMRVPTPALAILAFIGIEIMLTQPWRRSLPLMIVFALGLPTPLSEISRPFRKANEPGCRANRKGMIMEFDMANTFRVQYLAPYPNRFVR
ncbi:MAG: hypothetical protein ABI548_30140 [Polyangiaceae bacterium]